MSNTRKKQHGIIKFLLLTLIFFTFVAAVVTGILVWNLPSVTSLKKYRPPVSTEVYSKEYIKIGEFFDERRIFIPFEKIPPMLIHAFISAEDASFYEHGGISFWAILRATIKNIEAGYKKQGGSTITQQVARGMLLTRKKDYTRKIREIVLAMMMEKYLSKQEILEIYLNQVYLGQSSYGVQAASHVYFGKDVQDLNLAEISIMAGLTKAPSRDNPAKDFAAAKKRQAYVLQRLVDDKHIPEEEKKQALETPIHIQQEYDLNLSVAPYFVENIRQYVMKKYGDEKILKEGLQIVTTIEYNAALAANKALKKGVEELDHRRGYRGPLKHLNGAEVEKFLEEQKTKFGLVDLRDNELFDAVITSINNVKKSIDVNLGFTKGTVSPESMEWVRMSSLKPSDLIRVRYAAGEFTIYQDPLVQGSLIALNPITGEVVSMVGGYDYKKSEFNRTLQGKRQPGSAFKPIIYTAALDNGFTPASILVDAPIIYDDPTVEFEWKPQNSGGKFYGDTIFRDCLVLSRNIPTIKIVQQLGLDKVIEYATKMGVTSPMDRNLSLALGSSILTPMELVTVYSVLASGGKKPSPIMIKKITDRMGNLLETHVDNLPDLTVAEQIEARARSERIKLMHELAIQKGMQNEPLPEGYVLTPQTSYMMVNLLKDVITSGTGHRASTLNRPAAGKTGTTNDNFDAWFVGFTPNLVSAVWLGFDDVQSLGAGEEGGRSSTPVWLEFMKETLDGKPILDFPVPAGVVYVSVDAATGKLANEKTSRAIPEVFKIGTEPTEESSKKTEPAQSTDFFMNE